MKFKNLQIYFVVFLILIGFVCGKILVDIVKEKPDQNSVFKESSQEIDLEQLKLNELELPNKIYTFLGYFTLNIEDIFLEEVYTYYLHIELMTHHNVTLMNISIWDPDGKKFQVFESKMFYDPECGRSFDILYVAVMSGNYTFRFDSISDDTYDLYIRIEQGKKISTISSPNKNKDTKEEVENSIPLEWIIGITVFIGVVLGIPCIALFKMKKRFNLIWK